MPGYVKVQVSEYFYVHKGVSICTFVHLGDCMCRNVFGSVCKYVTFWFKYMLRDEMLPELLFRQPIEHALE